MKRILLLLLVLMAIAGCVSEINPETGEKQYKVNPEVAEKIDQVARTAPVIKQGLDVASVIWPSVAGILGIVGGGLVAGTSTWKKLRPKIDEAENKATHYYHATEAVVQAIEEFKSTNKQDWDKLKEKLAEHIGLESENVIRALRNLPEKT